MANILRRGESVPSTLGRFDPFEMIRDLARWDPFREMVPTATRELQYVPQFDVRETKDGYVFKADLPGIDEKDLEVSVSGNRLSVSGKREAEKADESDTWYSYERSYGSFCRSFTLPEDVDQNACNADLKNGVLTLVLGKKPEKQPKKISIHSTGKAVKA